MRRRFVTHLSDSESDSDSAACNRAYGMMMSKGDRDENAVAKPAGSIWDKKQVQPLDGSTGYYAKKEGWFNRILPEKRD